MQVYHYHDPDKPDDARYVGRPGSFGNPYVIGLDGNREEVLEKYMAYLIGNPQLMELAKIELKGKDLVCWCAPRPCHADILMKVANDE